MTPPPGVTTEIKLSLVIAKLLLAETLPNCTSVAVLKPEPAIDTFVPPLGVPELGEMEVIVGPADIGSFFRLSFPSVPAKRAAPVRLDRQRRRLRSQPRRHRPRPPQPRRRRRSRWRSYWSANHPMPAPGWESAWALESTPFEMALSTAFALGSSWACS